MKHHRKKKTAFPLVPINYKNRHYSYLFQALFSSLVVAFALLVDNLFEKYVSFNENNTIVKVIGQFIITMIISLLVIYILYFCFGWGDALLGR